MAFTAYDSEDEWILDPTYGQLVFNSYSWGPKEDGTYFTDRIKLNEHICQRDELGLEDGEAKFLSLND